MNWIVPAVANVSLIILTGYKYPEPRFWILLGILFAYQTVYGVLEHNRGYNKGKGLR